MSVAKLFGWDSFNHSAVQYEEKSLTWLKIAAFYYYELAVCKAITLVFSIEDGK